MTGPGVFVLPLSILLDWASCHPVPVPIPVLAVPSLPGVGHPAGSDPSRPSARGAGHRARTTPGSPRPRVPAPLPP